MKSQIGRRSLLKIGAVALSGWVPNDSINKNRRSEANNRSSEVPDTLDLADRARLAINGLVGAADPANNYETFQSAHFDHRPPYMNHMWAGPCLPKAIHALPMLRIMCGSDFAAGTDGKMLEAVLRDIGPDGLWWQKIDRRPWRATTYKVDQANSQANGRLLETLLDWNKYRPDPKRLRIAEGIASGLSNSALRKEDRAWFGFAYTRSGWLHDATPSGGMMGDKKVGGQVAEPESTAFFNVGVPLRGLARWYGVSGDKRTLRLCSELAAFITKPTMWRTDEGPTMLVGSEHGHWHGHFHTHTMGMMGLLEYAIVANDATLQRFVAEFYEYSRSLGIARIGFFPSIVGPLKKVQAKKEGKAMVNEGCNTADMIWLAARLSEAGIGDYYDDIDQYVRNHLVEHQLLRRDLLEEIVAAGPTYSVNREVSSDDGVLDRAIGSFASPSDPGMLYPWWTLCCVSNCSVALYKAWESIVRWTGDTAQVNLMLSRSTPWLDVESYLPYEGKVIVRNKKARKLYVRLPLYCDKNTVRCSLNSNRILPSWSNNRYLVIEGLTQNDAVTIDFPIAAHTERWTEPTNEILYTCRFKGNTLIDISPRPERPAWTEMGSDDGAYFPVTRGYPIYQRTDFDRFEQAPLKTIQRYVSPVLI